MEPEDIEGLKIIAKKENRLMSSHARHIILKYMEQYEKEQNGTSKEEA